MNNQDTLFRLVAETTSDLIARLQTDGTLLYVSPQAQTLLGYAPETMVGTPLQTYVHPDDTAGQPLPSAALANGGCRLQHQAGHYIWCEGEQHELRDEGTGRVTEILLRLRPRPGQTTTPHPHNLLATLQAVNDALFGSLDLATVAERALDVIAGHTNAPAAVLFTVDKTAGRLNLLAGRGLSGETTQVGRRLPLEGSLTGLAVRSKTMQISHELHQDERLEPAVRQALSQEGLRGTVVSVPVLFQDEALGAINLIYAARHNLPAGVRQTIPLIAQTIGTALANAQYMQQIERDRLERQQLTALLEETSDYVAITRPDGTLVFINNAARHALNIPPDIPASSLNVRRFLTDAMMARIENEGVPTATANRVWTAETTLLSWDGHEIPVSQVLMAHRPAGGEVQYLSTIARSLSEAQRIAQRRSQQVHVTNQIAQTVTTASELGQLYHYVVNTVQEQFGYYHTQLLRYEPGMNLLQLVVGYGPIGARMLAAHHQVPLGSGAIGQAAATNQSVLLPDLQSDTHWQPDARLPEARGELAVPICFGDRVLGVLDVLSNVPNQLSNEDQMVLEGLCGQIAVAVETTRLRQEAHERLRELNSLQRLVSREGWRSFQGLATGDQAGYIYDQVSLQPMSIQELPAALPPNSGGNGTPAGETPAPPHPLITTPLRVRGEIIGTIGVENLPDSPLTPEDQALLEAVSIQVAEALENARLLEQTQKRAVELETVSRVGAATSTILESERLLQSVVDLTKRSFDLYHVHIYLLDEEEGQLVLAAGAGHVGQVMKSQQWRIPLSQTSLVARVARQRQGLIVNDVRVEPDHMANPLLPATRSEMAVPMIASNRLLGVLDVQSDHTNFFSDTDVRTHTALATQVAVALQNAMLYEEQLKTAEKLREVERLKSEFLASMSHELRTPLNSIIGFADVLLEGLDGELTERMMEDVQLIRDSGQYLRELIGDILDMSKIEAGKMKLRYEVVDLPDMVNEIMANTRTLAMTYAKEYLTLTADIRPNVTTIYADRTRLKQVMYNIISNAIKFTEDGGVKITMQMQDEWLVVAIADSGIGIKQENLEMIFEQFRQVDSSLTSTVGGTGLGLPISRSLVELHGGEIWVESRVGRGTTFWFKIPRNGPPLHLPDTGPLPANRR